MATSSYISLPQRDKEEDKCGPEVTTSLADFKFNALATLPLRFFASSSKSMATTLFRGLNSSLPNPDESQRQSNARSVRNQGIRTDWLDGMRGVASFIVFIFHHAILHIMGVKKVYNPAEDQTSILQLPLIRILWCGSAMVSIFFVISGYALSISHLQLIHAQKYEQLFRRLSSSVFRRAIRLFVPTIVAGFMYYLLLGLGLLRNENPNSFQTEKLFHEIDDMLDPFRGPGFMSFRFNDSLWTIPVEFRGSLVIYITLLGLARLKPLVRMAIIHVLFIFFMHRGRWDMALFMAGVFLAESNLLTEKKSSYPESMEKIDEDIEVDIEKVETKVTPVQNHEKSGGLVWNGALFSILMMGLYILTYPEAGTSPFYDWVPAFGIQDPLLAFRVRLSIGAVIVTTVISFMPRWQALFTNKITCYLGKISFGLYLTHNLLNRVVGSRIVYLIWSITGRDTWIQVRVGFFIATILYLPIAIWVADVFWRLVDVPSVNLARRAERFCSVS